MAAITDKHGAPVQSVDSGLVSVVADNVGTEVVEVRSASDLPLHLGVVLLASKNTFNQQQAAAQDLVDKLVRPGVDEAFVVTAGGERGWPYPRLDFSGDPKQLSSFIKGLDKNSGVPDSFEFGLEIDRTGTGVQLLEKYNTSPIDPFTIAAQMLRSDPRPARRIVVAFRDPWLHSPGYSHHYTQIVQDKHDKIISELQRSGISVFVIGLEEPNLRPRLQSTMANVYGTTYTGTGSANYEFDNKLKKAVDDCLNSGRVNLERISEETGGTVVYSTKKNYPDAVSTIVSHVNSIYSIVFVAPNTAGGRHAVKLSSKGDIRVDAPNAFWAGQ
jgi:hypothetical protein